MSEKFAFEEIGCKSRTMNGNKWISGPWTILMDRLGDHFLTRARFSL
ncbi:MAG: hypothetical protein BWY82_02340 [Verrucomicrobia bacterium ADurb.Bin474]|nr:MAG: hypothetical protein BWY82_02340 [Verrucomicrobia bacterium ADurb.Bin474]